VAVLVQALLDLGFDREEFFKLLRVFPGAREPEFVGAGLEDGVLRSVVIFDRRAPEALGDAAPLLAPETPMPPSASAPRTRAARAATSKMV